METGQAHSPSLARSCNRSNTRLLKAHKLLTEPQVPKWMWRQTRD